MCSSRIAFALAIVLLSGCPTVSPTNGTVKCSADPAHLCPDGYVCVNRLCWKDGQEPATPDLSTMDLATTPADLRAGDMPPGKRPNGVTCMATSDCASGFCVAGVCCNTACTDSCSACNVAGNVGTCSAAAAGMSCSASSCDPTSNMMIGAGSCDAAGKCIVPNPVSCGPYKCQPDNSVCWKGCVTDSYCVSPNSCNVATQLCGPKPNGNQCGSGTECSSGNCVDGYCCDKPQSMCNGCNACNVGPNLGKCSPVSAGGDPHATCPFPCSGGCNGAGACASGSSNTVCAFSCQDTCGAIDASNFSVNGQCGVQNTSVGTCTNNPGMCSAPTSQTCPGSFTCASATACKKSCNKDADCLLGYFCSGPGGTCLAQLPIGDVCTRSSQCQTFNSTLGDAQCMGVCVGCASKADCFGATCSQNGSCIGECMTDADCTASGAGSHCTSVGNHNICTCATDSDCTDHRARGCFTVKSFPSVKACGCNSSAFNGNGGACHYAFDCVNWGPSGYCLVKSGGVCTSNNNCSSVLCQSNGTCF